MPAGNEVRTPLNTLAPTSHIVSHAVSQPGQLASGRVQTSFSLVCYDLVQYCLLAKYQELK